MYIHIGKVIKECRMKKGWSMRTLSMHADVQIKTILRIEHTGHGNLDSIEKLLGAMGYELEVVPRCGK